MTSVSWVMPFSRGFAGHGEILGVNGQYATDEKVITCIPPTGWPDAGPT